jgi:hypothetical protein
VTTAIASVTKQQMTAMISELDGGRWTENEVEAFKHFVLISTMIWAGSVNDQLLCLWGLVPPTMLSDQAYLWLHTTEAAKEHEFVLVRRSQIELKKMLAEFPRIVGHCQIEAEQSIRWLKWLGAAFGEPEGQLIPFVIRRKEA